jgi:hypothetical protein
MKGTGIGRRLTALFAAVAVVLQAFLPFAALATAAGPSSVICSSAAPSGGPAGHHGDCSCAAGCGICCVQVPLLPATAAARLAPLRMRTADLSPRRLFHLSVVRFAPQAARPPPRLG